MKFKNRADAGQRLAEALTQYKAADPVILALAPGGILVAREIAKAFGAPLDIILIRKVGPHEELALDDGPSIIGRNEDIIAAVLISETDFQHVCQQDLAEIERLRGLCVQSRGAVQLKDRVVIVVDDGFAAGAASKAALRAVAARKPKALVLAVPVASNSILRELRNEAGTIVCLKVATIVKSVASHYSDLHQQKDTKDVDARLPTPVRL